MAPEIAAALISGGIALTGSVGSAGFANAKNAKLQKRAFEYEQQMIAQQNAYNTPLAQLGRYKEAGLNPNLIYGDSGASAGNQTQHADYQAPTYQMPDISNVMSSIVNNYFENRIRSEQVELLKQQIENAKEQQFKTRAERHGLDIDNMVKSVLSGFDPGLIRTDKDIQDVLNSREVGRYDANINYLTAQTEVAQANKAFLKVKEDIGRLDYNQRKYYNEEIQPLMREIIEKRSAMLDISKDLLLLHRKFFTADKIFHYAQGILQDIAMFIKPFGGLGMPSGKSSMDGQWYGSPFYPDESLAPGL